PCSLIGRSTANSVFVLRQAGEDMPVAGHPLRLDATLPQRLQPCAAGFAVVLAVAEAAAPEQVMEFDEAGLHIMAINVTQAELADAGRVDQLAAAGKVKQPGGGGGVGALAG